MTCTYRLAALDPIWGFWVSSTPSCPVRTTALPCSLLQRKPHGEHGSPHFPHSGSEKPLRCPAPKCGRINCHAGRDCSTHRQPSESTTTHFSRLRLQDSSVLSPQINYLYRHAQIGLLATNARSHARPRESSPWWLVLPASSGLFPPLETIVHGNNDLVCLLVVPPGGATIVPLQRLSSSLSNTNSAQARLRQVLRWWAAWRPVMSQRAARGLNYCTVRVQRENLNTPFQPCNAGALTYG